MLQFVRQNRLFGVVPMLDNRHDQLLEIVVPLFTDVFLLDQANQLGVRPFKVAPEPIALAANTCVQSIIVDDSMFCDLGPARFLVLRRRLPATPSSRENSSTGSACWRSPSVRSPICRRRKADARQGLTAAKMAQTLGRFIT